MKIEKHAESIDIRPGVSVLSVLRHLNYKPWFAFAEFVDNALQSYLEHREGLNRVEGAGFKFQVSIEVDPYDGGRMVIRDNAAGIHEADYRRAFRPAELPPDRTGLCEFGMGMKSAACWFGRRWSVRTSALGEEVERTVDFDIDAIVRDSVEELRVTLRTVSANVHFTEVVLSGLYNLPQAATVGKIKKHLASIYRVFIRSGLLELRFNNELLVYPEPDILLAPYHKRAHEEGRLWRKDIEFDFGLGLQVHGFAALRATGSTSSAGFALFRRSRLIEGSGDDTYRPEAIFGRSNSFTYQRLFGELHLDGFEVSHTKDGFRWDDHEEAFLKFLREHLDGQPLPLLDQAEGHRSRPRPEEWQGGAEVATQRTAEVIQREVPPVLERQVTTEPQSQPPPASLQAAATASVREIDVQLHGCAWRIRLELSIDPAEGDWVTVSDQQFQDVGPGSLPRCLVVRVSLAHPFMDRFAGIDAASIEPLLRVAAAIGLAETAARDSGVKYAGTVRRNINELLRDALSKQ